MYNLPATGMTRETCIEPVLPVLGSRTNLTEGRCWRDAPSPHDRPEHTATQGPATFDDDWSGNGLLQVDKPLAAAGWR